MYRTPSFLPPRRCWLAQSSVIWQAITTPELRDPWAQWPLLFTPLRLFALYLPLSISIKYFYSWNYILLCYIIQSFKHNYIWQVCEALKRKIRTKRSRWKETSIAGPAVLSFVWVICDPVRGFRHVREHNVVETQCYEWKQSRPFSARFPLQSTCHWTTNGQTDKDH